MNTTDNQKKNAAEVLNALRTFHKTQNTWDKLNLSKAPNELREPAWKDLKSAAKGLATDLDMDLGSEKLRGAMYVVRQHAITQTLDRKLLSFNEQRILSDALQIAEDELRTIADIKQKPFVDRVAEIVARNKAATIKEPKVSKGWKEPDGYVFADAIWGLDGEKISRRTVAGWAKTDNPDRVQDPKTKAVYYRKVWVDGRVRKHKRRT
ncbi:MAG: hypothetical protein IH984_10915 [Planctomycetes bacterium]|nr:hypothetical protein [Planctomycetota bacterium]